ncbi:hypothetical protein [Bradyrhizobium diazoefficiens]|nr:hypothetical protein XF16B_45320 [Bradyrhizobium diazoefficiens]BCF70185.1 hypothetical protein XF19B_45380 [Bradyrhizobium diazoefficiens]
MSKTAQKTASPPPTPPPSLNAKFKSRLPQIIEEICKGLAVIEPAVQDVSVPLREFHDYLTFEIAKLKLELERAAWDSKVDQSKVAADKAWLAKMEQLQKDFDVERMTSSITFIRSMVVRVQDTFDMRVAY